MAACDDTEIATGGVLPRDPRSTEVYGLLRARGQSHGRALRSIADRLLRLLIAMLKSGTLFDPSRWAHEAPAAPATEPA